MPYTSSGVGGYKGNHLKGNYLLTILLKPIHVGKNIRNEGLSYEISSGEGTILTL